MPKICYIKKQFSSTNLGLIVKANQIIEAYMSAGYSLTLRQLYYRFVAQDLLPNMQQSYKRLGGIINDAKLAGFIDWEAIEDRTRNVKSLPHWSSPASVLRSAAQSYQRDLWRGQEERVEVWVEKEALIDVVGQVCNRWDVAYFACRGYVSGSELWSAARRLAGYDAEHVTVLHLGDHDPSGIDMSRDMQERLDLFESGARLVRVALNMDQIELHDPPPNPAKSTDARFRRYIEQYGFESWELDALEPSVLDTLIEGQILERLDEGLFEEQRQRMEAERARIVRLADGWQD